MPSDLAPLTLEPHHVDLLRRFSRPNPPQIAPSPGCIDLRDAGLLAVERMMPYGFRIATTEAGLRALREVG